MRGMEEMRDLISNATGIEQNANEFFIFERDREFVQRAHASADRDDRISRTCQKEVATSIIKSRVHDDVVVHARQTVGLCVRELRGSWREANAQAAVFKVPARGFKRQSGRGACKQNSPFKR